MKKFKDLTVGDKIYFVYATRSHYNNKLTYNTDENGILELTINDIIAKQLRKTVYNNEKRLLEFKVNECVCTHTHDNPRDDEYGKVSRNRSVSLTSFDNVTDNMLNESLLCEFDNNKVEMCVRIISTDKRLVESNRFLNKVINQDSEIKRPNVEELFNELKNIEYKNNEDKKSLSYCTLFWKGK